MLRTHTAFPQSQFLAKSKSEKRLLTRAETAVALVYAADTLRSHKHENRLSQKARRLLTRAESSLAALVYAADTYYAFTHANFG